MSEQLNFLGQLARVDEPRKSVRKVSRENIYRLKDSGALSERTTAVLNALAHRYYVTQKWSTPAELAHWMFTHGKIPRESTNVVAPRLTDLVSGAWVKRRDAEGKAFRVKEGGGMCELLPRRVCTITGNPAHPVRIREAGSVLTRFGYVGAPAGGPR